MANGEGIGVDRAGNHGAALENSNLMALSSLAAHEAHSMREDHRLHSVFKNELDALEDKLSRQMGSFRGQLMRQGERLSEAFLNPLEAKVNALESRDRRIECQLADLSGSVKGLIDELQLQVTRADKADAKFQHWRKLSGETYTKLEDQIRRMPQGGILAGILTPSRQMSADAPEAEAPQSADTDFVTRHELMVIIHKLRQELQQETRSVVEAALREHLASKDWLSGERLTADFDWLRQDHHNLAKELAVVTQQVKAEQVGFGQRFDAFMQELRRVDSGSEALVSASRDSLPGLGMTYEIQGLIDRLEARTEVLDLQMNDLLSSVASSRDVSSVTERLARLAARVCEVETAQHKEHAIREHANDQSPAVPPAHLMRGSPSPAVPKLDFSCVQTSSPALSAQMAAWAEGGISPDPSSMQNSDVAIITSIVEDAVWNKLRGHFFKMLSTQQDLVDHLGKIEVSCEQDPDLARMYKTLSEVVDMISPAEGGSAELAAVSEGPGVGTDNPLDGAIVHLWRDELAKLWRVMRVILEHVEKLENLIGGSGTQEVAESLAELLNAPRIADPIMQLASRPADEHKPETQRTVQLEPETLLAAPPPTETVVPRSSEPTAMDYFSQLPVAARELFTLVPPQPPSETLPAVRMALPQTEPGVASTAAVPSPPLESPEALTIKMPWSRAKPPPTTTVKAADDCNSNLMDSYISPAEVEEQWRLVRETSEAVIQRKQKLDRSIGELRSLASARRAQEHEDAVNEIQ